MVLQWADDCRVLAVSTGCVATAWDVSEPLNRIYGTDRPVFGLRKICAAKQFVGVAAYTENSFTRHRRQAPTRRCTNPTLVGGSDDEAACTTPVPARAPPR
jgi:hypothetical protein